MLYKFSDNKIITKAVEYSVAYHCNLSCSGCSHMSPFIDEKFPSLESFYSDIAKLRTAMHANEIRLCGGEPLLNPEIKSFVKIARQSGIADKVSITTNGLLLHRMDADFWENVDSVVITLYPKVNLDEKKIQEFKCLAEQSNTELNLFSNPTFRTTIVTRPHPKDLITDLIFKTCDNVHFHHCHMIHEGKLYKCAVPPFLPEYLAKMGMVGYDPQQDAFDIHRAKDMFNELKTFLLSSETMEACRYCLGYLGNIQDHCQLRPEVISNPRLAEITRKEHFDIHKLQKLLETMVVDENEEEGKLEIPQISKRAVKLRCSVIIPSYNRSRYLPRAIKSVLNQTFQDFEIIIVDDCSNDNTVEVIQELASHDNRIKLVCHERNKGAQAARNTGIVNSTGEYIAFLDSDDEWLPEHLQRSFEVMQAEAVMAVHSEGVCSRNDNISPQGIPELKGHIYPEVLKESGPMFQGLLLKRECLEEIGLLDESIISYQEWDTFIRLAKHFEFGFVSEPGFIWHWHQDETISKDGLRGTKGYYQVVKKHKNEMVRVVGVNGLLKHYMQILEGFKDAGAAMEFQEVKAELKTIIDTSSSLPSKKHCQVQNFAEQPDNEDQIIKAQLLDFQNTPAENRQSARDHSKDSYRNRKFFEGLRDELIRFGVRVKDVDIDITDFEQWFNDFPEIRGNYISIGSYFIEKTLEHYLAYKYLKISEGDVYIDIAASGSPWANALKVRGIDSYRLDLIYPKGVNGIDIGADATDTHLPDSCATVISAQCAYECFRGNADIDFIKESSRILNGNGRLGILPLYVEDRHMIVTGPYCNQKDVPIDEGAERIWRDDEWMEEPFSRKYSPKAFAERIYSNIPKEMQAMVLYFRNLPELMLRYPDQHIYCFFMLYCEMVRTGVMTAADNCNDTTECCGYLQK